MRRYLVVPLLLGLAGPAAAQGSSPAPQDPPPAARLPVPVVDENAPPSAFLEAAARAVAHVQLGEATEALERAETRILTRSVRRSRPMDQASDQALVRAIAEVRAALARGELSVSQAGIAALLRDPNIDRIDE